MSSLSKTTKILSVIGFWLVFYTFVMVGVYIDIVLGIMLFMIFISVIHILNGEL